MLRLMSARRHVLAACAACLCAVSAAKAQSDSAKPRTNFPVDPRTPARLLLPPAPKAVAKSGPLMSDDLAKVPEVSLQEPFISTKSDRETRKDAIENIGLLHSKLRNLDLRKPDAFAAALHSFRADLAGLPLLRGDSCRLTAKRATAIQAALKTIHDSANVVGFWNTYSQATRDEDGVFSSFEWTGPHVMPARIAGLMQIFRPRSEEHASLATYLAGVAHVESTKALARIALFSPETHAREYALKVLDTRRERDYDDVFRVGLRYPHAPIVKRTTEALVKLGRSDWLSELVDLLDEPDPRLPTERGDKTSVVRELVRVNHARNCMLCHAPAQAATDTCAAPVAIPGESSFGYNVAPDTPEIFVRFDITYLRQDFSTTENGERFDYLVRTRKLSPAEVKAYQRALTPTQPGTPSPYQRAVLAALRDLTGRDAAPTTMAWRELLKIEPRR